MLSPELFILLSGTLATVAAFGFYLPSTADGAVVDEPETPPPPPEMTEVPVQPGPGLAADVTVDGMVSADWTEGNAPVMIENFRAGRDVLELVLFDGAAQADAEIEVEINKEDASSTLSINGQAVALVRKVGPKPFTRKNFKISRNLG